ncbi:monooxygenase [Colletotrichum tamarilloi]|uniref:Monooxygenase n=1 Tax=Colletotrichum tamarilloi TaxID=1209934 RepID=A0ABQ9QJZ8_9PEZI|nr:monooxygenase [Colletotrichum tamarilloi]KAK1474357.1 monooxygenase [Colletotrichum tamarilloi]
MASSRITQISKHLGPGNSRTPDPKPAEPYVVVEQPLGTGKRVRIITIGSGASGLNMIRTFRQKLTNFEHIVYEKNPEVGGTWYENRYPGCKCDIPSHNYQFSWKPNKEWSSFLSPAEEIQTYLCRLCDGEDLRRQIKTNHLVTGAFWDEDAGGWTVRVKNLEDGVEFEDYCEFLLNASGILNNWKWPDIPGLHDFSGSLLHSADWDDKFDWKGKRVAIIGNGSSGVQIVPAVQRGKDAKEMIHFIRGPTWIMPPRVQTLLLGKAKQTMEQIELDDDENFTPAQIHKFKSDPALYKSFVKAIEEQVNNNFFLVGDPIFSFLNFPLTVRLQVLKDSETHRQATAGVTQYMQSALNDDQRLIDILIPKFPISCRRMTPGVGYLESLTKPNARVISGGIARVVLDGLVTESGEHIAVDAIVCATGFDVSFRPRFPIIGRRSTNLQDIWAKDIPKAYMSCAVPEMPNYFVFLGPNAPIGHGSVFTITELLAKYIAGIIKKCQTEGIKSISPSLDAVNELHEHTQAFMPRTAWAGSCRSWFKGGAVDGPVTALHPGSRIHFFHMLENFRGEDWDYVRSTAQSLPLTICGVSDLSITSNTTSNMGTDAQKRVSLTFLSTGSVRIKLPMKSQPVKSYLDQFVTLRRFRCIANRQWTEPLPIGVFLIAHPGGPILFDTGESPCFNDPGYLPYLSPTKMFSSVDIKPEDGIVQQLQRLGVEPSDLQAIVLSHLHGDHAGGLKALKTAAPDVPVFVSKEHWAAFGNSPMTATLAGCVPQHWPEGFQPTLVDFSAGAVGPWETSGRVTADGKVVAVHTPGHVPGHISLVVYGDNEDGTTSTYCLLGDASYGIDLLDKEEPDGINDDPMSALDSLRKIKAFAKQSDVVVLPSHDPDTPRLLKERVLYKPQDI